MEADKQTDEEIQGREMMGCKQCKLRLIEKWDAKRRWKIYQANRTIVEGYLVKHPFLGALYGDLKCIGCIDAEPEFLRIMKNDEDRKRVFRDYGKTKKYRHLEGCW